MKNILITGANRGLGFEIARQIYNAGYHVFLSGRSEEDLENAREKLLTGDQSVETVVMDVSSDDSVKHAAQLLYERRIMLDVIVNNAGILLKEDDSLLDDTSHTLITIINTNSYGPLRVVKEFIHLMNTPGRIINISSGGGSMSDPVEGWSPAYCTSKTLLNAITRHLAYELRETGISVNAVCPGWLKTDMGGRSAPRTVEKGAHTPVWLATEAPQELTGKFFRDKREIPW
ncbi:MAG TPA: SDR family NAD(P)-dependent oxidoreductase [Bacteroidales bacterium]|nr:SDR family NAD(P)-dependent oxidoreductase [Bacteroidales bacterium]